MFSPLLTKLILSSDHTSGEQVYAEIPSDTWSEGLRCESAAPGNQIPLLVHLPNLIKALQSCAQHDKSHLRLLKRSGRAFLSIDSDRSDNHKVTHEVPVQVMQAKALQECEEPFLDEPAVKINLPPMSILGSIADKMKQVSEILDIEATSDGTLTLAVNQSQVQCNTDSAASRQPMIARAHEPFLSHPFLSSVFAVQMKITSRFDGLRMKEVPLPGSAAASATPQQALGGISPLAAHAASPAQNQIARVLALEQAQRDQAAQQAEAAAAARATPTGDGPAPMELDGAQPSPRQQTNGAAGAAAPAAAASAAAAAAHGYDPSPLPAVAASPAGAGARVAAGTIGPPLSPSALHSAVDGSQLSSLALGGAAAAAASGEVIKASARVSIKKFLNVTAAKNLQTLHAIACQTNSAQAATNDRRKLLCEPFSLTASLSFDCVFVGIVTGGAFVVYLKLKNRRGTITYYLPLIQD